MEGAPFSQDMERPVNEEEAKYLRVLGSLGYVDALRTDTPPTPERVEESWRVIRLPSNIILSID